MPRRYAAYIRTWLFAGLATIFMVAVVNLLVDPFGIYRLVDAEGFNRTKVRAGQRGLLSKTYNLERAQPRSLIMGNSRAEIGFDPEHPEWPASARPVYNFALPGAGIQSNLRQLEHALRSAPVEMVVLGLDFRDFVFDAATFKTAIGTDLPQGASAVPTFAWGRRARDHAESLLSLDTLLDSIRTVVGQRNRYPTSIDALGFNPLLEYIPITRNSGYRVLFDQRNMENARVYLRAGKDIFLTASRSSPDFESLKTLIRDCHKANVRLYLVIYPYHAHTLELFKATGLWTAFEEWKRETVRITAEAAATSGATQPYPLWDFSGYNSYTIEDVPERRDLKSEMRWYWEGGHFKKALGDLMLNRVLGQRNGEHSVRDDFGTLLNPSNVESHLRRIRTEGELYAKSHPSDTAYIRRIVASAR